MNNRLRREKQTHQSVVQEWKRAESSDGAAAVVGAKEELKLFLVYLKLTQILLYTLVLVEIEMMILHWKHYSALFGEIKIKLN